MNTYQLQSDDFISPLTGVYISYHVINWDSMENSISLSTDGGNIMHHTLMSATKPHTHQFMEICLVINGSINHYVNGAAQSLSQGDIVFIRPSDKHYFAQLKNENCEMVNFAVRLDSLLELSQYLGNDIFMQKFTAPVLPAVFRISRTQMDDIVNDLLSINTLQITNPEIAGIKAKTLLLNFFTRHFLTDNSFGLAREETPDWLVALCRKMKDHENLRGGIDTMTKLAPSTHEHLCKICKKYLKKTPTDIINEYRFQEAARRLTVGDDKISSIASDLGFQSQSYFHSQFKKAYAASPAAYRRQTRKSSLIPV